MIGKNNPLNIRSSRSRWLGEEGETRGFCNFRTLNYGVRVAMYLVCISYRLHGCKSYADIITRYAPPEENDTPAYIKYVCSHMSVNAYDSPYDDEEKYIPQLIHYMSCVEGNVVSKELCYQVYNKYFKV